MTKGERRRARQAARATGQPLTGELALRRGRQPERDRTTAEVMLDWTGSRNRRRARVAREYWEAYESGRPMGSDDY